jgi:hypothetical protein
MGLWRLRHNTARPDVLAADEAQPVEALFVAEVNRGSRVAQFVPKHISDQIASLR